MPYTAQFFSPKTPSVIADGANLDSFSRLRVSNPTGLWQAQLTYDLQPMVLEAVTAQSGAAITHDATNRCAVAAFSSTPTGGKAFLQGYEYIPYQPGKSQMVFVTFNFVEAAANVTKFAGYSDGVNGIEIQLVGSQLQIALLSSTGYGNQTVLQQDWVLDRLDGTGRSGKTFDISKTQILVLDLQALYAGRVRVGFDIDGSVVYVHQFLHANVAALPYIAQASLPVRKGMTCTGTATTTMILLCSSVISEGGQEDNGAYAFSAEGTVTAGSGTRTQVLTIRPNLTVNSITNRVKFVLESVDYVVTGNSPVKFELVVGQALSGSPTYTDANAALSAFEYTTGATLTGDPAVVVMSSYCAATAQTKASTGRQVNLKYPITLNAAGAVRVNGTISVLATGIGGTSACRAVLNWKEIR